MRIKEFLKPNRRKILVFVIFILLFLIQSIVDEDVCDPPLPGTTQSLFSIIKCIAYCIGFIGLLIMYIPLLLILIPLVYLGIDLSFLWDVSGIEILLILSLICYVYLFSCLIPSIWDKFKYTRTYKGFLRPDKWKIMLSLLFAVPLCLLSITSHDLALKIMWIFLKYLIFFYLLFCVIFLTYNKVRFRIGKL